MKTLRTALVLATALVASAAFAGPRGKTSTPSAAPRDHAAQTECKTMLEKSGKRTTAVPCDGATDKCKAHCAK